METWRRKGCGVNKPHLGVLSFSCVPTEFSQYFILAYLDIFHLTFHFYRIILHITVFTEKYLRTSSIFLKSSINYPIFKEFSAQVPNTLDFLVSVILPDLSLFDGSAYGEKCSRPMRQPQETCTPAKIYHVSLQSIGILSSKKSKILQRRYFTTNTSTDLLVNMFMIWKVLFPHTMLGPQEHRPEYAG